MKYKAGTVLKCKNDGKIWHIVKIDNVYLTVSENGRQHTHTYQISALDANFSIINRKEKLERIFKNEL